MTAVWLLLVAVLVIGLAWAALRVCTGGQVGPPASHPLTPGTLEVLDALRRSAGREGHRHATDILDQRLAAYEHQAQQMKEK